MSTSAAADPAPVIPEWSFGDRLRKVRRLDGASQADFAKRLGTNQKTYAAWELDATSPRNAVALAKRVEAMTGVPASWMLGLNSPSSGARRGLRIVGSDQVTTAASRHAATPIAREAASQGAEVDSAA